MIPDPYIPEQVVDPEDFVGRFEEIERLKTFLDFWSCVNLVKSRGFLP